MKHFFVSDHHFFHENILKFCNRPFADTWIMTEELIDRHNSVVDPADHCTFMGDLTMLRGGHQQQKTLIDVITRMHGHKRLIFGNHDHFPPDTYLKCGFEIFRGTGQWMDNLLLSHYPVHPSSLGKARACIHGHIHDQPSPEPVITRKEDGSLRIQPYINVSVENTGYRPLSLDEINQRITDSISKATNGLKGGPIGQDPRI